MKLRLCFGTLLGKYGKTFTTNVPDMINIRAVKEYCHYYQAAQRVVRRLRFFLLNGPMCIRYYRKCY